MRYSSKKALIKAYNLTASTEYFLRGLTKNIRGIATCLQYHRVLPRHAYEVDFNPMVSTIVAAELFEEQIRYLAQHCNCISLSKATNLLLEGELQPNSVIVTFDDGYKDNLLHVLPILKKYSVPATIYVTTGFPDKTCVLWWYELDLILKKVDGIDFAWKGQNYSRQLKDRAAKYEAFVDICKLFAASSLDEQGELLGLLRSRAALERAVFGEEILSWNEIISLGKEPLIEIGAHTVNHPVLNKLSQQQAAEEIRASKERLEEVLGHSIGTFAYPFGSRVEVGKREFDLVKELGFKSGVTSRFGHIQSEHKDYVSALPRVYISHHDNMSNFKAKLYGVEAMFRKKGKRVIVE